MAESLRTFAIAVSLGLLLGFEREHRQFREHGDPTPLGTRTLAVLALAGALARTIDRSGVAPGLPAPAWVTAAGMIAGGAVVAVSGGRREASHGTTTAATALAGYLLGALVVEDAALAVALAALLALVLESKPWLRRAVREVVSPAEVEDAVRWFVLAFVVLPLVPDEPVGPSGAIVPSRVWELLLLLSGIGWLGYIGTRFAGRRRGLLVVGAAGGFVSGAATTAALARLARRDPSVRTAALGGALLASVATCVQVVVLALVASRPLGIRLIGPMAAGAAVLLVTGVALTRRLHVPSGPTPSADAAASTHAAAPAEGPLGLERPLALRGSVVAAAVLSAAIAGSTVLVERAGTSSAAAAAAATGLADAHAALLATAQLHERGLLSLHTAVLTCGAGLLTNTVTKLLGASLGGRWFLVRFAAALAVAASVVGAGLVLAA